MQFKALFVFALPVLAAPAAYTSEALDLATRNDPAVAVAESSEPLEKREVITGIVTSIAIDVGTQLATEAANAAVQLIKDLSNWDDARERFTKATAKSMMDKNPDVQKYPATICYNKGYRLKNPAGMAGKVSVDLKTGVLHTNYDCFYMEAGNAFWSDSDGGYINLAIQSDPKRCSFDSKTADLTC